MPSISCFELEFSGGKADGLDIRVPSHSLVSDCPQVCRNLELSLNPSHVASEISQWILGSERSSLGHVSFFFFFFLAVVHLNESTVFKGFS